MKRYWPLIFKEKKIICVFLGGSSEAELGVGNWMLEIYCEHALKNAHTGVREAG